jgi:hypothetical protein
VSDIGAPVYERIHEGERRRELPSLGLDAGEHLAEGGLEGVVLDLEPDLVGELSQLVDLVREPRGTRLVLLDEEVNEFGGDPLTLRVLEEGLGHDDRRAGLPFDVDTRPCEAVDQHEPLMAASLCRAHDRKPGLEVPPQDVVLGF